MKKTYAFIATLLTLLAVTNVQAQIQTVNDTELSTINGQLSNKVSGQFVEIGIIHYYEHLISDFKQDTVHVASLLKQDAYSARQDASSALKKVKPITRKTFSKISSVAHRGTDKIKTKLNRS